MPETHSTHHEEIDLSDTLMTLWQGKWTISVFVVIGAMLGIGFASSIEPVFESRIVFFEERFPPLHENKADKKALIDDFERKFYSEIVFEQWKESNKKTPLSFEEISRTKDKDGFAFLKSRQDLLVVFKRVDGGKQHISVNSDQPTLLDEVFKYTVHVNSLLTRDYVLRTKKGLNVIGPYFGAAEQLDGTALIILLSLDRFISDTTEGANLFTIQRPTSPKKVSPKSQLLNTMGLLMGLITGVIFLLVSQKVGKRKEQLENPKQKT